MWRAVVTLADGSRHESACADRDRLLREVLDLVPEELRDWMAATLALGRWSWLFPTRTAASNGVSVVVTRDRN